MRRFQLALLALVPVLALAGAAQATAAAPARHAHGPVMVIAHASKRFTCPDRTVCWFTNDNWTGGVAEWSMTNPANRDTWITVPQVYRQSMTNQTDSDTTIWSHTLQVYGCVTPHNRDALEGTHGYFYVQYGDTGCNETDYPPGP